MHREAMLNHSARQDCLLSPALPAHLLRGRKLLPGNDDLCGPVPPQAPGPIAFQGENGYVTYFTSLRACPRTSARAVQTAAAAAAAVGAAAAAGGIP